MQLKKIKLAGFKSFVDPTVVLLPSKLVAVVGPNGCGKSNIIDAVCWVMGETSAKYLRGESLTDVIFNGSGSRKPVGQATVELVFDNQDGTIGGEYAGYAEISLRRLITREGDSVYFLNGTRCRRRDIIDIFLGTGLGPRSYSIIGQNMISRVIESRPDDMRVYMEEAAGISKYKERRRETENRIKHTKENLARLTDIRTELEKQLGSLKRQASAAERFKVLKQEERILRAQWQAVQWQQHDARLVEYSLHIQQQETALEARQAELGQGSLLFDNKREEQRLANETFQDVQKRYYAAGNDITRIEQEIRHHQERVRQWQTDLEQANHDWQMAQQHLEELEEEQADLAHDLAQLEPASEIANEKAATAVDALANAEDDMQNWQNHWDTFNQRSAKTTQTAQVEQTRIQQIEQRMISIKQRQTKLELEQAQIDFADLEQALETLTEQVSELTALTEEREEQLLDVRETIAEQIALQQKLNVELDQVRNDSQRLHGRQASLEALQQTALGQKNNYVTQWLSQHQLDKKPRLAQGVEVASGWEHAVEKVLGASLQAVCVDTLAEVVPLVENFTEGSLCLFSGHQAVSASSQKATTLLSKITSRWPLESLLSGIYIAETQAEALALCETLESHESVITPQGTWISPSWLRVSHDENPAAGVFQREQELKQLISQIETLHEAQASLEETLADNRDQLNSLETQRDESQRAVNQLQAQFAEMRAQHKTKTERLSEIKARAAQFRQEQEEVETESKRAHTELTEARAVWQAAMQSLEQEADERDALLQKREACRETLQVLRQQVAQIKEESHQLEIRLQTTRSQHGGLQQTKIRMQAQLKTLDERKLFLEQELSAISSVDELEETLSSALALRLKIEEELNDARSVMSQIDQVLRDIEHKRHMIEAEIAKIRDMLETMRLEWQSVKIKAESLAEQIRESGLQLEDILKELPPESVALELHSQLEQVIQRITRLGPINLVAIEEYATCSERKEYLDKQDADLQEGLATLENAIAKIDKETRARFKETFDKVNERFQELFPTIFGGGRAYLELTGENLLDAGVAVMACPPGKRNSTIHLLSGGEKALTAIALVFSIFHLNPAPFCMLDEVDAPLDDVNVGRYCQLVKTMSEKTQFIFISHNKLAIEMAEHLMGVTMHEPGVSRLVSVNVQEAMSLAGS